MLTALGVTPLNGEANEADADTGADDPGVAKKAANGKANQGDDLKGESEHQSSKKSSRLWNPPS